MQDEQTREYEDYESSHSRKKALNQNLPKTDEHGTRMSSLKQFRHRKSGQERDQWRSKKRQLQHMDIDDLRDYIEENGW